MVYENPLENDERNSRRISFSKYLINKHSIDIFRRSAEGEHTLKIEVYVKYSLFNN